MPDILLRVEDLDAFARCLTEVLARHLAAPRDGTQVDTAGVRALLLQAISYVTGT